MITRIYEAKTLIKHISCDCKYKFNSETCNPNQKWNNDKCQWERKKYRTCKKDYGWKPITCICENSKYLKCIVDDLVIVCDENMNVMDSVSTNMTNTISTNVASSVSIKFDDKKVRYKMDYYILHKVLLVIILLLIIAIICYHYTKHRSKQKRIGAITI